MNILVLGSGARENAIVNQLAKTSNVYAYMTRKNPGIAKLAQYTIADEADLENIKNYAKTNNIEIAFIGPEAPLEKGVVDVLEKENIKCIGPNQKSAQIETNKAFMRQLFKDYDIPGSIEYGVFYNIKEAEEFIDNFNKKVVIKPIGLTGGKGVKIVGDQLKDNEEAKEYTRQIFNEKISGFEGVVIEELLEGEEYTIQAFVDGENLKPMPAVQDHPHAFENNQGPITGGMGSYTYPDGLLPFLSQEDYDKTVKVLEKTVESINKEVGEYRGILYGQFMLTKEGPKIIEYNARFGDPEAMNVLSLLNTDLTSICKDMVNKDIKPVKFNKKASVCKYVVPDNYPNTKYQDTIVKVDEENIQKLGGEVYYAAVYEDDEGIKLTSSRALGVIATADTISEAESICEDCMKYITGNIYHRSDIATKKSLAEKQENMKKVLQN
ncbi:MAG: phosphoribosylamine--glycine ligase [Methanobacteriaceae archaeon]|nr:phosphoribosylamine--glycine ligase [Methanobacteriaceae archaeon]